MFCTHTPACPPFDHPARDTAAAVAVHPEQGWSLLCNGVIVFADTGEILPDGRTIGPHRAEPEHAEPGAAPRGSITVQIAGRGPLLMPRPAPAPRLVPDGFTTDALGLGPL